MTSKKDETDYVLIPGVIARRVTFKAILYNAEGNGEIWVPRSVCRDGRDLMVGDEDVQIAEWWLKKTGVQY